MTSNQEALSEAANTFRVNARHLLDRGAWCWSFDDQGGSGMIHTNLCDVLGIDHPIVQAGMARSYTNAELVAAVSAAGGLGVLGCLGRPADEAVAEIRRIRALTDRPFAVNFVLHLCDEAAFAACLAEQVPIFCFFRGDPAEAVARVHAAGAVTVYQVTTVAEAVRACAVGVDVLVAQGHEAGGHMGPIPLRTLLPEVVAVAGARPVLAAGGIVDGRDLAAALRLGASGVLIGTRFLATPEAPATATHKRGSSSLLVIRGSRWGAIGPRPGILPLQCSLSAVFAAVSSGRVGGHHS